jgi:hypothetical protein
VRSREGQNECDCCWFDTDIPREQTSRADLQFVNDLGAMRVVVRSLISNRPWRVFRPIADEMSEHLALARYAVIVPVSSSARAGRASA